MTRRIRFTANRYGVATLPLPLLIIILTVAGCDAWWILRIRTADEVTWLTDTEKTYIEQINQVRTNPRAYAQLAVKPALEAERKRIAELRGNGHDTSAAAAFRDLISDLYYALVYLRPMNALEPALGLTLACRDQCADPNQSVHSSTSPGSETPWKRAEHYANGARSEIAWPTVNGDEADSIDRTDPWSVVLGFLIDMGDTNRPKGHRYAILDRKAEYIGIAYGANARGTASVYALLGNTGYVDLDTTTPESKHSDVLWNVRRIVNSVIVDGF